VVRRECRALQRHGERLVCGLLGLGGRAAPHGSGGARGDPPLGHRPVGGRFEPSLLVAVVAAVGLLLVVIRWSSFPQYHAGGGLSYNVGARYGIFLALIAGIAEVTAAVMARRSSGEQAPSAPAEQQPAQPEPGPPDAPAAPEE
jgi:hypothetical protein